MLAETIIGLKHQAFPRDDRMVFSRAQTRIFHHPSDDSRAIVRYWNHRKRTWRRLACTSRRISRPARPGWCSTTRALTSDSGTSPLCSPARRECLSPSLQAANAEASLVDEPRGTRGRSRDCRLWLLKLPRDDSGWNYLLSERLVRSRTYESSSLED